MASDHMKLELFSNGVPKALETGDTAWRGMDEEPSLFLRADENPYFAWNHDKDSGTHTAVVHLNPAQALQLAIFLMDWAREHMEGLRLVGDFGVDEFEAEDAFDPYFGDEPDYEPKRTAINQSGYPVDVQQKPEHRPLALNECQCGACRDWRMTH